jgi:predicted metal-dependent hydrolase
MFEQNRDLIRREASEIRGLMDLLMKHHNTGVAWTPAEKTELRSHLKELARIVPALCIFLLPFGALFLPLLAVAMDRRKVSRSETPTETSPTIQRS